MTAPPNGHGAAPAVTVTVQDLRASVPPETPNADDGAPGDAAADALRAALAEPYDLARWETDLRALAGGAPTGFDVLDDVGMRWTPGKLYAVIARPGGGKTAMMLEAAARAVDGADDPTATAVFCSWEEPLAELVVRLFLRADALAQLRAGGAFIGDPIPRPVVRAWGRGAPLPLNAPADTHDRLGRATPDVARLLARLRLVDGDTLGRYVHPVLAGVGAWMRETGTRPALVAVDYFQKLRASGRYTSRQTELQDVADALRRFAKGEALTGTDPHAAGVPEDRWAVPVVVGAQVNRVDLAIGHPSGDNIREADDLLNDAAAVVALSYEDDANGGDGARWLRVSVPKHRDGRARRDDAAQLHWQPARAWISPRAVRDAGDRVLWTPYAQPEDDGKPRDRRRRSAGADAAAAAAILNGNGAAPRNLLADE